MSILGKYRSLQLRVLLDPRRIQASRCLSEAWRRLCRRRHVVSVFLQIDDPYSYILSCYLPALAEAYDIELCLYLSEARGGAYQPAPEMLAEYAVRDCTRLARELGIPFLDKGNYPPTEHRIGLMDSVAVLVGSDSYQDEFIQALAVYWRGDSEAAARRRGSVQSEGGSHAVVATSQTLQRRLGHYNSAMLHYAGEWFWGVDRLHYLLARLNDLGVANGAARNPILAALQQSTSVALPVRPPAAAKNLPPIEFFYSFRSPYSYLALGRIVEITDAFGIGLRLRPVLPMVMRGMKVPRPKLLYIAKDTSREAKRRGVPFGRLADPVGSGIERCLAVFYYAESEHRAREFTQNAGTAIWAEGIDVATDRGLRKVSGRTGLFWPDVKRAIENSGWRARVEDNRESLMGSGAWGVPVIRMGGFLAWGQDRDWILVRHLEELCDTGEGIIV